MSTLPTDLRKRLDNTVQAARERAEEAAASALHVLGIAAQEAPAGRSPEEKELRRLLREEARRLGDAFTGDQALERLIAECAYEQWHRMLFARFLTENDLLMHPAGVPVSLEDCAALVESGDEPEADGWAVAAKYAARMLPGIFRNDDPLLRVRFDAKGLRSLEELLDRLPSEAFTAEDSLGWVYQFWQTKRKKQVNDSAEKVGGDDLCAVTQLFTEPYMVQFLLHNTLGAWWLDRHPGLPMPIEMPYLRTNDDGTPAAGGFSGWPGSAAEITIMDPCCGSGHFLVSAFQIMTAFRQAEEGLSSTEAGDAVLRDNIHGLELDPRCTQIAAFNLALAAWKHGGYRDLPLPHIACSGLRVGGKPEEWTRLAFRNRNLGGVLNQLFTWFQQAPDLGSLIDPRKAEGHFVSTVNWAEVLSELTAALERFKSEDDPAAAIFGQTALGAVRAAELLFGKYTLVSTNVPYLGRRKQADALCEFSLQNYAIGKADLATAFTMRCLAFTATAGTMATVTPRSWWFQPVYKDIRRMVLTSTTWNAAVPLGEEAWHTFGIRGPKTVLSISTNSLPGHSDYILTIDTSSGQNPGEIASMLLLGVSAHYNQLEQLSNPDARVTLGASSEVLLLSHYASSAQGLITGDGPRYTRQLWEIPCIPDRWRLFQSTADSSKLQNGLDGIVDWSERGQNFARLQGMSAWGNLGVAVSQMRDLPVSIYSGEAFDSNMSPIIPKNQSHLPAIWSYCSSAEYSLAVRHIDQSLKVTNATLVKVPFDLEYWQKVAEEKYPDGLPEPHSDDPTQWLFKGNVVGSERPLHVAMARLLGYRWPDQEPDGLDELADGDGIVCIPSVLNEDPAVRRLETLLERAYGDDYSPVLLDRLLAEDAVLANHKKPAVDLEAWLRNNFFDSHCRLFHNRPFLWHIWDGNKQGGFSAIVNYHTLDHAKLQTLAYSYLEDWIRTQREDDKRGVPGANGRLTAAISLQEKLGAILTGDAPHDILVRWKARHEQQSGWAPDLNDGVRLNIRPFYTMTKPGSASDNGPGVLRSTFTIHWNKDKGKNAGAKTPEEAERRNDLHLTLAEKQAARQAHAEEMREALERQDATRRSGAAAQPDGAIAGKTDLFGNPVTTDLFGEVDYRKTNR